MWIGISMACLDRFDNARRLVTYCISPIFVATLLIFVSGIPLLEKKADERWGDDEGYQRYKKMTPVLVPFIGRCGDAMF